jgi:predicted metalloprotease
MKWEGQRQSDNVEDRRGQAGPPAWWRPPSAAAASAWAPSPSPWWPAGSSASTRSPCWGCWAVVPRWCSRRRRSGAAAGPRWAAFVSTVLATPKTCGGELFKAQGSQYQAPRLVLFRGATPTACGTGQTAMGPFYCPGDQQGLHRPRLLPDPAPALGAPGDFAQAYVVAHEVGHHVQNLLGITAKVDALRARARRAQANALSVRLELQADCLAGVWAHHSQRRQGLAGAG